ncbi:hypothetical protein, partial [Vagococcus sp.]|uniref:hypothetical protein n=1 Tax=Vagococcus sp. TaxID=1933889 RepID=UPI002FC920A8
KNVFRTKGIISTFILSELLAVISFFCFYVFQFVSHMQKQMIISLEKETDFVTVQMSGFPITTMFVFKLAAGIITMSLILLLVGTVKRSFYQFLLSQKEDIRTMYLLGESTRGLIAFSMLQIIETFLVVSITGLIVGKFIFFSSVIKTIQIGLYSEDVNTFNVDVIVICILLISMLLYVIFSTFISSSRKIKTIIEE